MEPEASETNYRPSTLDRVLSVAGPVFYVAISYLDPGKWATAVEGGARLGSDLVFLVLVINLVAILCQYLSARVAIITGKNLTEICIEEYDDTTCLILGIQAQISMVAADLTMVIGTAYGLHTVFGVDLFSCVFFTGFDAILFPFVVILLDNSKAKLLSLFLVWFLLVTYVCGILTSQPESSLSMGGMLSKLSGENMYALMGVLGANIMPHNLYLHSSLVQQDLGQTNLFVGALCQDHFFATLCIFSGIFLLNTVLINSAASLFYSSELVSLTLQDAMSLLDQIFRSSTASFALILIMFFSNQLVPLSWFLGKQVTSHGFFRLEIPSWLHRVTIRLIAIIPALYCVWSSGTEGLFQMLIFTQVLVAFLLPSSVIPLFRISSSRSVMGVYKISHVVEFLAILSVVGMLMLNLVFDMEMLFGSSDWVTSLKWNSGGYVPISYLILLLASIVSLCFMLWLVITPLKSVSSGIDSGAMRWENEAAATELSVERDETEDSELEYKLVKTVEEMEPLIMQEKILVSHQKGSYTGSETMFPETLSKPESNLQLSVIPETECETSLMPSDGSPEASSDVLGMPLPESGMITKSEPPDTTYSSSESKDIAEKTLKIGRYVDIEKDEEGDSWEREESVKNISESVQSVAPEGPESFRSLSGKTDDVGSGTGSLSRLAGLGRAARRQLTSILDEFWGQLFDFHGQVTPEAKARKLDVLLGIDSKVDSKSSFVPIKMENNVVNPSGYFPSAGGRGSDVLRMHNHPVQGNAGPFVGVQKSSTMQSSYMQLLDAYVRSASYTAPDSGERRFHSVHVPSSSNGHDQQPATIHGYDMASYLNRTAKEKGYDYLKGQMEPPQAVIKSNSQDLYTLPPGQKPQSALRNLKPPGFHNVPVSRNNSLRSERPVSDLVSSEAMNYTSRSVPDVKKFHSLPDISLYLNSSPSRNSPQWESPMGYGPQSIRRPMREQVSLNAPSWASSTPSVFNELSPSKVCRDAFSLQFGSSPGASSLWSRQPYEQFGVADKSPSSKTQETTSNFDMEAKVLQSFRSCITKLLRLEGSDWLFRQNDGADEDLIDQVAERERFLYEAECRTVEKKLISPIKMDETDLSKLMAVPNCGDGCVWKIDLIVSFGVWCIHRILELSLMESRPELWGKYTYVLNRLQGIIDLAFSKPRSLMAPCFCLQLPAEYVQKASPPPPTSIGGLPPHSKPGRGKFTNASMLLDIIKDVETAISCRKGRSGTAAGDVAFPKGKENLASVLKRYKRRLSIKPVETGGMRKNAISSPLSS